MLIRSVIPRRLGAFPTSSNPYRPYQILARARQRASLFGFSDSSLCDVTGGKVSRFREAREREIESEGGGRV